MLLDTSWQGLSLHFIYWKSLNFFNISSELLSLRYQGNQWQLLEPLWLLDRLGDCSMHQSLLQEITSASAISLPGHTSARKRKKKKKPLWLQCSVLRLRDITLRTMVNSQLGRMQQQSLTERNLIALHHCAGSCSDTYKNRAQQQDIITVNTASLYSHSQNVFCPSVNL